MILGLKSSVLFTLIVATALAIAGATPRAEFAHLSESDRAILVGEDDCENGSFGLTANFCQKDEVACKQKVTAVHVEFKLEGTAWVLTASGTVSFDIQANTGCDGTGAHYPVCANHIQTTKGASDGNIVSVKDENCPTLKSKPCKTEPIASLSIPIPPQFQETMGMTSITVAVPGLSNCVEDTANAGTDFVCPGGAGATNYKVPDETCG